MSTDETDGNDGGGSNTPHNKISEADLLGEIQRLAEERGESPTTTDMRKYGEYSAVVYSQRFGGWEAAVEVAGLTPQYRVDIPKEALIGELQRLGEEHGRTPTIDLMAEEGKYTHPTYRDRFGSWNSGLRAAGFEPNHRNTIPDEELITAYQDLADELGHAPRQPEMCEYGKFGVKPYVTAFGSWGEAKRAAGYEPIGHNSISEEVLAKELRRLRDDLGHAPTTGDMKRKGRFSLPAYMNRFSSWEAAIEGAGLEPHRLIGSDHPSWRGGKKIADAVRRCIGDVSWAKRRQQHREKNGGICAVCGHERQADESAFDTHHIIPIMGGGCNSPGLLISLCDGCHSQAEAFIRKYSTPLLIDWIDDELPDDRERWTPNATSELVGQTELESFADD